MSVEVVELMTTALSYRASASVESEWRACISRAYYAAFHAADQFHKALPVQGNTSGRSVGLHELLIEQLTSPGISSSQPDFLRSKAIGYILSALKRTRVTADYQLSDSVDKTDVANALENASRLIEKSKPSSPSQ